MAGFSSTRCPILGRGKGGPIGAWLTIQDLHCPYCGGAFSLSDQKGDTAVAHCPCGQHPVVDGVLCMADDRAPVGSAWRWTRPIELIRSGRPEDALADALAPALRTKAGRAMSVVLRGGFGVPSRLSRLAGAEACRLVIDNAELTFSRAIHLLRSKGYADYLVHRYANPSIIAATALLGLLPELARRLGRPPRVLDLGGGTGHASFLISRLAPGAQVVLADRDFSNLYLGGRFLCPGAARVCIDAEAPLPFADGFFDCVFTLDSFHYVRSKVAAVAEMRRVLADGGLLLFAHLHNAAQFNPAPGTPLAAPDYRRVIGGDAVLKREDRVLDDFLARSVLDLGADDERPEECNAFLAADGPGWIRAGHDLSRLFETPEPVHLNPSFRVDGPRAVRRFPTHDLEKECAGAARYVPAERTLDDATAAHLRDGGLRGDAPEAVRLRRELVAIPLPERYGR